MFVVDWIGKNNLLFNFVPDNNINTRLEFYTHLMNHKPKGVGVLSPLNILAISDWSYLVVFFHNSFW